MKRISYILVLLSAFSANAQIVDDTSKLVYSSRTTKIIYELDVKNNAPKDRFPDTTLYKIENYMLSDRTAHHYQDLGNNGTAVFPVFYPMSDQIGKTSGFNVYDPYMIEPNQVKYYDTKSPFMDVEVVFGGNFRSTVDFTYARSMDESFSIGFDLHKITNAKQIGFTSIDDRNVQGNVFSLYSSYKDKNRPYRALFNVVSMNHNVGEVGGIDVDDDATDAELFLYQDSNVRLSDVKANDSRLNWHLYHEYAWQEQLQFYHQIDFRKQETAYSDNLRSSDLEFYGDANIDTEATNQRSEFKELANEIGIKGDLSSLFYRAYIKRRSFDFSYLFLDAIEPSNENFIGGYARFDWREKFNIEANAEFLQTGEYQILGKLNSDLIFASYNSVRAKVPIFYERYFGNHNEWNQGLTPTFNNEIKGGAQIKTKYFQLRPIARFLTMNNLVYLDQAQQPQQSGAVAILTSVGGNFNINVKTSKKYNESLIFENEIYYTTISGGAKDNVRVPTLFYNGRLFWRGAWFKKSMNVEVGMNIHAKTEYFAMDYSPNLQHFYLQDNFLIESFYTADFFINMQVNNVRVFVKMMHFNQQNDGGYFVTPYYPGEPRLFDLGVKWMFYD